MRHVSAANISDKAGAIEMITEKGIIFRETYLAKLINRGSELC
jgi:hypothetical protein